MASSLPFPHAGHFWRGLHQAGHTRSLLGGLALGALAVWLVPATTPIPRDFLTGMVGVSAMLILWWMQVESLLQQNRPMLARLVPGHAAALRRSLVLQWLLHTAVWTSLLVAQLDAWPRAAAWAAGLGVGLFVLVWLVRHPVLWLGVALLFFGSIIVLGRQLKVHVRALRDALQPALAEPGTAWLTLALGATVLALLLRWAIGSGGEAHRRLAERRDRMVAMSRAMQTGCGVPVRHQTGITGWVHRLISQPWQVLLAQALRPGAAPASIGRLNLLLAGPSHWARQLGMGLLIVVVVVLPLALMLAWLPSGKQSPWDAMRFGLCMGVFSMGVNPLVQLGGALAARRREQGLLMLAPGVPQGAVLRDAWTAYQMRQFLIGWGLCTAGLLGVMLVWSGPGAQRFVAGFAAGCLPWVALAWRDWARLRIAPGRNRSAQLIGLVMLGGATVAGGLAERLAVDPVASLALGAAVTAGLALWGRLRRAQRPAPFPVGRLQG